MDLMAAGPSEAVRTSNRLRRSAKAKGGSGHAKEGDDDEVDAAASSGLWELIMQRGRKGRCLGSHGKV